MNELVEVLSSCRKIVLSMSSILEEITKEYSLTTPQLMILRALQEASSQVSMSALQEQLSLSGASTSTLVDRLVRRGLVERQYSEVDRRRVLLRLTPEGYATAERIFSVDSALTQKFTRLLELPSHDMAELLRIHQKILNNCTEMGGFEHNER